MKQRASTQSRQGNKRGGAGTPAMEVSLHRGSSPTAASPRPGVMSQVNPSRSVYHARENKHLLLSSNASPGRATRGRRELCDAKHQPEGLTERSQEGGGNVELWINALQGGAREKRQFGEGNLLRWADARGIGLQHATVTPHRRGEHLSLISFFGDVSIIQAVSILYKGSGRDQRRFSGSCSQPHSPFREHSSLPHSHTSFALLPLNRSNS